MTNNKTIDIFVKFNEQVQLTDEKIHINLDIVVFEGSDPTPFKRINAELCEEIKEINIAETGRANNVDLIFKLQMGKRAKLRLWAEGQKEHVSEYEIITEQYEKDLEQSLNEKEMQAKLQQELEKEKDEAKKKLINSLGKIMSGKQPVKRGDVIMLAKNNYNITGDIIIKKGGKFVIEAGSILEFATDAGIVCYGIIEAVGTSENPIIFTADKFHWCNITLYGKYINGCRLEHCKIEQGAGRCYANDPVSNNLIPEINNDAEPLGGGLALLNTFEANVEISNLLIRENIAEKGGGIFLANSNAKFSKLHIKNNKANDKGGGIYISHCAPAISDSVICENQAKNGGGGFLDKANAKFERINFEHNEPDVIFPITIGKDYKCPMTDIEFVFVKGGVYQDGCVNSFYIGKYLVTQGQWKKVMSNNPSGFKNGPNYPVEKVNCDDVQEFIGKVNELSGAGLEYRLPSEAEWEYAATGGCKDEIWAGAGNESEFGDYAWLYDNSGNKTHPVGTKKPNKLGLYDMLGNVWEWTSSSDGSLRMYRGGSWDNVPKNVRASNRSSNNPTGRSVNLGFRLARTP